MKRLYMKEKEILSLPIYYAKRTNEATLYSYSKTELIKYFHYLGDNKINTIYEIERQQKDLRQIKELLLFQKIVVEDYQIIALLLEKGYPINFKEYLKNNPSYQDKILFLKKIGLLLEKLNKIRTQEGLLTDFFIGDLQEANILIDEENHNIQICDMDSCKIGNNKPFPTKYLQFLKMYPYITKKLIKKYPLAVYSFIPNHNTDLYCYMVMILKILFSVDITKQNFNEFYQTLYALKSEGLPKPLYESFLTLFGPQENQNPYLFLEDIPYPFEKRVKNMI